MSKRGGGLAKNTGSLFLGDFYHLSLFKIAGRKKTVFKSPIHFQRPTKWFFFAFCRILQNVAIYAHKVLHDCLKKREGVQPVWAMPVIRLFKKGFPTHMHLCSTSAPLLFQSPEWYIQENILPPDWFNKLFCRHLAIGFFSRTWIGDKLLELINPLNPFSGWIN